MAETTRPTPQQQPAVAPAGLARRGVWFLDRAAAARLTAQGVEA